MNDVLKTCKVMLLDADGVWFNGQEIRGVTASGEIVISKIRHFHDGQGLSFLRALGIKVLFVSGKGEPLNSIVEKINTLPSVKSGAWPTVEVAEGKSPDTLEQWLLEHSFTWSDCVYFGDDKDDVESMRKAACVVCPGNARRVALKEADIILSAGGGDGAVREFAEMVLDARGIDEAELAAA